jgi:hypothetical protein
MLLDIGTEEIAHVEMLATMIGWLLQGAPLSEQEAAVAGNPAVAAVMGGMNPQHAIVNGLGVAPNDSVGFPWTARYIVSSWAISLHAASGPGAALLPRDRLLHQRAHPRLLGAERRPASFRLSGRPPAGGAGRGPAAPGPVV